MDLGLSLLGLQGYSAQHAKDALSFYIGKNSPRTKRMAYLWNSFGGRTDNIRRWYEICDRTSITQVYLSNETDRRRKRIDSRNLLYQLDPTSYNRRLANGHASTKNQIKVRVSRIMDVHTKYGVGSLEIALGLEDNMNYDAAMTVAQYIREVAGNEIKLIRNPVKGAPSMALASCDTIEYHEMHQTAFDVPKDPYGMVTDGYDICLNACPKNLSQILTTEQLKGIIYKFRTGKYFMLWHSIFNSLRADAAYQPEPYKRKSNISRTCIEAMKKIQEFSLDIA